MKPKIKKKFKDLLEKITEYNLDLDINLIQDAFSFALKAHRNQYRSSGEDFITHPLCVAEILLELKLDTESIVTALLHDTVEDTNITLDAIKEKFGQQVASLVQGVTKLDKIEYTQAHVKQAENFRKLLVAISKDIRVLMIKLADRLHNMRTLDYISNPQKRKRIAMETMDIYAPLAERIGTHKLKNELQDLSFKALYPEIRDSIMQRMSYLKHNTVFLIQKIEAEIMHILSMHGINAVVYGREKTCFAIWKKMERKKVGFEQLSDIIGFRILVQDVLTCYKVLGVMHTKYQTISHAFKDYISIPKSNGYQSLHTLIIGPEKKCIEVQIRTHSMHEVAEIGVAAHWAYKQNLNNSVEGRQFRWVQELLSILENTSNPGEIIANTKLNIIYDQVFCFTPTGNLVALPAGSTVLDFAFTVHSDLGLRCAGAKINGILMPISAKLESGDQVFILSSTNPTISYDWIDIAATGKAKAAIKRYLKQMADNVDGNITSSGAAKLKNKGIDKNIAVPKYSSNKYQKIAEYGALAIHDQGQIYISEGNAILPNNNLDVKKIILARCCCPVPGDKIVGVPSRGMVVVHVLNCLHVFRAKDLVDLSWFNKGSALYSVSLSITIEHYIPELISNIVTNIERCCSKLAIINIKKLHNNDIMINVTLGVKGARQVHQIMELIKCISGVKQVSKAPCTCAPS